MATLATLIAGVRASTDQDIVAGQEETAAVKDSQITTWINEEYAALWRILSDAGIAPTPYLKRKEFTLTSASNVYDIGPGITPNLFERIWKVERKNQANTWEQVGPANWADPEKLDDGYSYAYLEVGATIEIYPIAAAPGDYRLTYVQAPGTLSGGTDGVGVPAGVEKAIVERVAARVRVRFEEDPTPHLQLAAQALDEAKSYLRKRGGVHPQGLVRTRLDW